MVVFVSTVLWRLRLRLRLGLGLRLRLRLRLRRNLSEEEEEEERERERNQFDDARQLNGGLNKEHINVPEKNLSKKYMHDGKKASAEASTGEEGTRTGAEAAQGL